MRVVRCLILSLFAISLALSYGCGHRSSDIKTDLQNRYKAMDDAQQKMDVNALGDMLAPDFMAHMADGRAFNRSQMLNKMGDQSKEGVSITSSTTVDSARLNGDQADATVTSKQKIVYSDPSSDKQRTVEITSSSHDAWQWVEGNWKLVEYSETKHATTVDGTPIPAAAPSTGAAR